MNPHPLSVRHLWITVASLVVVSTLVERPGACNERESVAALLDVGSRLELAVDPRWIDSIEGARLDQKTPVAREVVMQGVGEFGYLSVLQDGDMYRMYHRTVRPGSDPDGHEFFCYLESRDGIRWSKPNLDLFTIPGLDARNAITEENMAEPGDDDPHHFPCISHNLRPFLDTRPDVPKSERFKALAGGFNSYRPKAGFWGLVSADGIHWRKLRKEWVIDRSNWPTGTDSTPACAFWSESEQKYVAYIRIRVDPENPEKGKVQGLRWIGRLTSPDFINWSKVTPMKPLKSDPDPARIAERRMHYYTNETQPYFRNRDLLIATPTRYFEGTVFSKDQLAKMSPEMRKHQEEASVGYTDSVLMTTRPGELSYRQPFAEAFLRPGPDIRNWSNRSTYAHVRFVPTSDSEMSFWAKHGRGSYAHVRRYTLRIDGFASVRAPLVGGSVTTKPLKFTGERLVINYSTSGAGSVRVEIQDESGAPVAGFALADSVRQVGDAIEQTVRWESGSDVGKLSGRTIRLRFVLHDADLYAFRFASN